MVVGGLSRVLQYTHIRFESVGGIGASRTVSNVLLADLRRMRQSKVFN